MTQPELIVKNGADNVDFTFQILDADGVPRDISTLNGADGMVRLYIINRFTRDTVLDIILVEIDLSQGLAKWTLTSATIPPVGFYDGELWLENIDGTYKEPYDEFPLVVKDARISNLTDRAFEEWP